jgi:hypothetical protein
LHESWNHKKPTLEHLKVFGCDAYVHYPKEKRSMLDNKANKWIFLGYNDGVKGYNLWNPKMKNAICWLGKKFREVKNPL